MPKLSVFEDEIIEKVLEVIPQTVNLCTCSLQFMHPPPRRCLFDFLHGPAIRLVFLESVT